MTEPTKAGSHKTLAVKLPPRLHAQLELISGLEDIPMGTALLRAVELYVETKRGAADFAARAAAAVAEAERQAAERRDAIQALLGAGSPASAGPEPDDSSGQAKGGRRTRSGEASA
ncbi:hypothetical protein [Frankia sp. KB5]|uniref:hypothetical protein n=1 Tax=Frankia sp. KB5 TaxID=683318 RepID=UPI000E2F07C9|nr:hypothetical protein [Frankia sp. KB5]